MDAKAAKREAVEAIRREATLMKCMGAKCTEDGKKGERCPYWSKCLATVAYKIDPLLTQYETAIRQSIAEEVGEYKERCVTGCVAAWKIGTKESRKQTEITEGIIRTTCDVVLKLLQANKGGE